jgi:hypothetical protein
MAGMLGRVIWSSTIILSFDALAYITGEVVIHDAPKEFILAPITHHTYQLVAEDKHFIIAGEILFEYELKKGTPQTIMAPITGQLTTFLNPLGRAHSFQKGELLAQIEGQQITGHFKLLGTKEHNEQVKLSLCIGTQKMRAKWLGAYQRWGMFSLFSALPKDWEKEPLNILIGEESTCPD